MKIHNYKLWCITLLMAAFTACEDDLSSQRSIEPQIPITLSGEVEQISVTRVNDNGFCNGDVMGVYIVDYQGNKPGTLQNHGNRANNVHFTFDEAAYKWNSAFDVYWKDKYTPIDVYAYYPVGTPENVNAYSFEVQVNQATQTEGNKLGGYEASDFLWGKTPNVAPTEQKIRTPLRHRLSSVKVMLVEGQGFQTGEWAKLEKQVLVKNVKRQATINLSNGSVTAKGEISKAGTIPYQNGNEFRAIVVPQTVNAATPLFSLTIGGVPYVFKKQETFTYVAEKMHNFSIKVDKKETTGEFTFTLAGESITPWENDAVSHDATMKEYIVIHCEAGKLKQAIQAAKKDYKKLQNLKITGVINGWDFDFMRNEMAMLQSLNLKEVRIKRFGSDSKYYDKIPTGAFKGKKNLLRLILPDKLATIEEDAFNGCEHLNGSLIIPEGVTEIGSNAFYNCKSLTGNLSLPSTLKKIGDEAFSYCGFTSELMIPDGVEYIGYGSFSSCESLYGNPKLPNKLKTLGERAFSMCLNLTGSLEIPQGLTEIPSGAFHGAGFNGTLTLHDGINKIGNSAFYGCPLKGELNLPKNLTVIDDFAFSFCSFSGQLVLPKLLIILGEGAFTRNSRLSGVLEIPENILTLSANVFESCRSLEGIILPADLEYIQDRAFSGCYGLNSIVCKGTFPSHVQPNAFSGVAKDNFTLEVPEASVPLYQTTDGWKEFKRIAAHRELVCRPAVANALNTECTRRLVLNAESEWEVASMPDWCNLSQTSGNKKTELTLTIQAMAKGSATRTGEIVFRLKDKDYTHRCTVTQFDYQYDEDEIITLQKATKGNRGGINLVFLGDGFDAKDISEGKYLTAMQERVEHFFGIEPYKTYRDYFNVYSAIAVSPESGIGSINTIRHNKFETTFTGDVGLRCDYDAAFRYAMKMPTVNADNLKESLIIMTPNTTDYGGVCQMWEDGSAIAFCPMSTDVYPYDSRGVLQHEAGGHGFGKLGDEYIYHNAFIDFCRCSCCGHVDAIHAAKANGWFDNLSLSGKMHEVPWSHLIFHERYSDLVDIFEGGFMHSRGVFRSEHNSCMNNNIPYFSAISRESIVKRIKRYAGEPYSFEEFMAKDKVDAATTRFSQPQFTGTSRHGYQMPPVIHPGSPLK